MSDHALSKNMNLLEELLHQVVAQQAGPRVQTLTRQVSELAEARRRSQTGAEEQLLNLLAGMELEPMRSVARALTLWFDLANLAEDQQRVTVLRERERAGHNAPRRESISEAVNLLKQAGWTADQTQLLLGRLQIELVLTSHPTEAKRRTVRDKLMRLRTDLLTLQNPDLLPREQDAIITQIRAELTGLWQTDLIRPYAPSVQDEVARGLRMLDTLWEVVPRIYLELEQALAKAYPDTVIDPGEFLTYASWIGGDRDGHPYVTSQVTRDTLLQLRQTTVKRHLDKCRSLHRSMSLSDRHGPPGTALLSALHEALAAWPELLRVVEVVSPHETYRRFLRIIQWRLEKTLDAGPALLEGMEPDLATGMYTHAKLLLADLQLLHEALHQRQAGALAQTMITPWMLQVRVFGFHGYKLDIRQESRYYARVMQELLVAIDPTLDISQLDENDRCRLITRTLATTPVPPMERLSLQSRETLALFKLLRRAMHCFGSQCLGGHVISLTHRTSDVLTVLWFSCWAGLSPNAGEGKGLGIESPVQPDESKMTQRQGMGEGLQYQIADKSIQSYREPYNKVTDEGIALPVLPIVPLFETIDDLERGPQILEAMLTHPAYQQHLMALGGQQIVMIGYSDSTKDGGYLAACWHLYQVQQRLLEVADRHRIRLTFFHGRGGSLGRGGGPTARAIVSQPPGSVRHGLRMTEQGEVLADRYDDPQIAHRHLEQVVSATIGAATQQGRKPSSLWIDIMTSLAQEALHRYRKLIEHPGFMLYFESATPIQLIPDLQIGSRPSRRHGMKELSDLRAIPWVFSWTQSRQMIPAWYGLGHACKWFMERHSAEGMASLREMYQHWPFFRATLENAALALAKTDIAIARQYALLVEDADLRISIWSMIEQEYHDTRNNLLEILHLSDLLDDTPWLKASIQARNPYVDPLNLMQIQLLKRLRAQQRDGGDETRQHELRELLRITIGGIAAGVRTTG